MGKHILIAEPRDIFRAGLRSIFQGDVRVSEVSDVDSYEGLKTNVTTSLPDIVVVNQSLISDFSVLPKGCLVLLTSSLDASQLLEAYHNGAIAYLTESVSADLLCAVLEIKEKAFLLDPIVGWWIMDTLE